MKSKKGAVEMSVGTIVTVVLLMSILILGIVLIQKIFEKPHFKITKEDCWNETQMTDWYELDAGDSFSSFNLNLEPKLIKYYKVRPIRFNFWSYLENNICFDVFAEKELYPDEMDSSQSLDKGNINIYIGPYDREIYVNGFTCQGIFYKDFYSYTNINNMEIELSHMLVKIPEFNESKVIIKEWGVEFDNEIYLINEDRYWDIEFRIISPFKEEICEQVEVDRIEKKDGFWNWGGVCYDNHCAIIKEDLTIDWLDENCICLEVKTKLSSRIYDFAHGIRKYNKDYYINPTPDGSCIDYNFAQYKSWELLPNQCQGLSGFSSERWKCSKYKCGDYFVEVEK